VKAKYIEFWVIIVRSPEVQLAVDNYRPLDAVRDRKNGIRSGPKQQAVDEEVAGKRNLGRLICAGTPNFTVGDKVAENLTPPLEGLSVRDLHIRVFVAHPRHGQGTQAR